MGHQYVLRSVLLACGVGALAGILVRPSVGQEQLPPNQENKQEKVAIQTAQGQTTQSQTIQPQTTQPQTTQPQTTQPQTTPQTTQPQTTQPQVGANPLGSAGLTISAAELSATQAPAVSTPGASTVSGAQATGLGSTDLGSLLGQSTSAIGVETAKRQPIANETRIRGYHLGQTLTWADGVFWFPARYDLDTMLSKIDSGNVKNAVVLKGPYSVLYGPGFSFIDVETNGSPRYQDGFEQHGRLTTEYKINGEQLYGRANVWGGDCNWGYNISYGHRTGNDYETGNDLTIPSSYNSRDVNAVFGFDLTPCDHIEIGYLRLDQTGLDFPGNVFDTDDLLANSFRARYTSEKTDYWDRLTIDGYYNRTTLDGNAQALDKRAFIPILSRVLTTGFTDISQASSGYRIAATWGGNDQTRYASNNSYGTTSGCSNSGNTNACNNSTMAMTGNYAPNGSGCNTIRASDTCGCTTPQLTVGQDFRYLNGHLNEFDTPSGFVLPGFSSTFNFPIPPSNQLDAGLFAEYTHPFSQCLTVKVGVRGDYTSSNIDGQPLVPQGGSFNALENVFFFGNAAAGVTNFERDWGMWMTYGTAEYKLNDCVTFTAGASHAERPPTLTELYAMGPYLAILQQGFTKVIGDPNLETEKLWQIDLGSRIKTEYFRAGANGFFSFIQNYITYSALSQVPGAAGPFLPTSLANALTVQYANTDLAILTGFELYSEYDYNDFLTPFMTVSYVGGRDLTRDSRGQLIPTATGISPTLGANGAPQEPLPGIPPLESRLGLRFHEGCQNPRYGVEFSARIVNSQDRVAASLGEVRSAGFAIYDIRGYWQARKHLLLVAGINNLLDHNYREHLDLRTGVLAFPVAGVTSGTGVFQPGISPYFGAEYTW
jgi:outer membrane receptor protein involved in Fe transport